MKRQRITVLAMRSMAAKKSRISMRKGFLVLEKISRITKRSKKVEK